MVAPDRVADQHITLTRLSSYRAELAAIAALGAEGADSSAERRALPRYSSFGRQVVTAQLDLVPAMPMKKAASSFADVVAFVQEVRPRRLHLLGMGYERQKSAQTRFDASDHRTRTRNQHGFQPSPSRHRPGQDHDDARRSECAPEGAGVSLRRSRVRRPRGRRMPHRLHGCDRRTLYLGDPDPVGVDRISSRPRRSRQEDVSVRPTRMVSCRRLPARIPISLGSNFPTSPILAYLTHNSEGIISMQVV